MMAFSKAYLMGTFNIEMVGEKVDMRRCFWTETKFSYTTKNQVDIFSIS